MKLPPPAVLFPLLKQASTNPNLSLKEGDRVASFDNPFDDLRFGRGERTSGVIGRIERITQPIERCARYEIRIEAIFRGDEYETPGKPGLVAHPPVNGTFHLMKGAQTFGVIPLPPSFPAKTPADPKPIKVFYVALYFVTQCYGGPEEGGWYFEAGVRKGKVKAFGSEESARAFQERAQRSMDKWHPENATSLSSVASRGNYLVEFHARDYPPTHYPESRPFYE